MKKMYLILFIIGISISCTKENVDSNNNSNNIEMDREKFVGTWSGNRKLTKKIDDITTIENEDVIVTIREESYYDDYIEVKTVPTADWWRAYVSGYDFVFDAINNGSAGSSSGTGKLSGSTLKINTYYWIATNSSANGRNEFWAEFTLTKN
jgi:hypothetical protein